MGAIRYDRTTEEVSNDPGSPDDPESPDDSFGVESLSEDDVFEILSNERRRYVIRYLSGIDAGPVRIRDLAERIAAWENDVPVEEVTYEERKRVYTSLHQLHLEKMDQLEIVGYDRDRGAVAATPITADLERYLETGGDDGDDEGDPNWGSFGLAVCCAIVVAAAWAGVLPFASGVGFAVASVFVIVTSAQLVDEWRTG